MRILFNITHGFQARMLLRTAIADELLAAGVELIVVSPNAEEPYFAKEFSGDGFSLEPMPGRPSRVEGQIVGFRQYLLMNPSLGGTLNYKRERYRRKYPVRMALTRLGNLALGNVPILRRAYMAAERRAFNGREFDELLRRHAPDLVVAGTPGFAIEDAHLIRAARRAGIPSATVMLSWDNLTSKGYMGAKPDHLLVWSELMRAEAIKYHNFTGPITEVGAAQFDIYNEVRGTDSGERFRKEHNIPQDAEFVVWGTINEAIYPGQVGLLREFSRHVESRPNMHLWVRIHPQSVVGPFAHLKPVYETLASDRIHIELPVVRSAALRWDLPREDAMHLAGLLTAADVLVVPRSTLTIDAACVDTPIVNLAIDPVFAQGFNYTHYKNVMKHDAVWLARSVAELCEAVGRYLGSPALHRNGRRDVVHEQLGRCFGSAGATTAAGLRKLAEYSAKRLVRYNAQSSE